LNYATLGFYWWAYEPERGKPNYEYTDGVAAWCSENGIVCKGHPLVWNYAVSDWLPQDFDEIKKLSDGRVAEIVYRYRGKIDVWDVVNEPTALDRFDNQMTKWALNMGPVPYTASALKIARQSNPKAVLLVNDYRTDDEYKEILEQLQEEGRYLFDAIGIQSHMHGGIWHIQRAWEVCEKYSDFGVPLHFTELTVLSGPKTSQGWNTTPEGEKEQADYVEKFYTTLFSHPAVMAITWWDFSDDGAWQGAPAGLLRQDLSPKPVYERLTELIKDKWWTKVEGKTDKEGKFSLRGFYGNYRITAQKEGRKVSDEFQIQREDKNLFTLHL
jgi:GH35 family endo-1,4-beta-xylanase